MSHKCQSCNQQPATVHLTDISPHGEKKIRHLCEACSQNEGVLPKPLTHAQTIDLLTGLVMNKAGVQELAELCCSKCKTTFVEFRNSGLLGCPHDYDAFEKALAPLIERAHEGSRHHIGKSPRRLGMPRDAENDLIKLKRELNRAVDNERYEEAAKLRDRIRILETR